MSLSCHSGIPDVVPAKKIKLANSINEATNQFTQILGQGFGGVLFVYFNAPVLFYF